MVGNVSIGLRVFVGSPNDVETLRSAVQAELHDLNGYLDGFHFDTFEYTNAFPKPVEPQLAINEHIRSSDLIILLFGSRTGEGTLEEYQLAIDMFQSGELRNLMVYFKVVPESTLEDPGPQAQKLLSFKEEVSSKIVYHDFRDEEDLRRQIREDVRSWYTDNKSLLFLVRRYYNRTDESLFQTMADQELPFSDEIIDLEHDDARAEIREGSREAYQRYLRSGHPEHYHVGDKDFYLIARFLFEAIQCDDFGVCRQKPFVFPIHQYLAKMIRGADRQTRSLCRKNLLSWLNHRERTYETSRDFAAFQLGMSRTREATDDLVRCLQSFGELPLVRYYAALALGMLREPSVVSDMIKTYEEAKSQELKDAIAHAVLFITHRN